MSRFAQSITRMAVIVNAALKRCGMGTIVGQFRTTSGKGMASANFELQLTHSFGENVIASVNSTNMANRRVLLENSRTFGGFHENDPREIHGEVRYRFHP